MTLSDDIKLALIPYLGKPLNGATLSQVEGIVKQVAIASEENAESIEISAVVKNAQIYLTLRIVTNTLQQQIDTLNTQVQAINTALDGLTIGEEVQAWDAMLDQLAALNPINGSHLAFEGGQITQAIPKQKLVGEAIWLPYDPAMAGWTNSGAIYTAPDGWQWYLPDGTGLNSSNVAYFNLFSVLWGTAAYTIAGGKGASAQADWDAGKTLIIPDMRGRIISSSGTATGGSTARSIGGVWGNEQASLAIANMPSHRHNVSVSNITASGIAGLSSSGLGIINNGNPTATSTILNVAGNRVANNDGLGAIADTGSGSPFNISQPSKGYFELWFMNTLA